MSRRTALTAFLLSAFLLSGCTTLKETYAGKDREQVWTAMVAVAQDPSYYPDWHMIDNEVWADEANDRIEVYRVIRRDKQIPLSHIQRQEREMEHQIWLLDDEDGPTIKFVARDLGVPINARDEAQLYFADVWDLLGGKPADDDEDDDDDGPVEGGNDAAGFDD